MRVLVAPCSYKGTLTAAAAAEALARGVEAAGATAERLPVADGGEGTLDTLAAPLGLTPTVHRVPGPLGEPWSARLGHAAGLAVVELAEAAGLARMPRLDAGRASTEGVGHLVRAALDGGGRRLWVTLGGSATTDGGLGLLTALGVRAEDEDGRPLAPGGLALLGVRRVDLSGVDRRLAGADLRALCDVAVPLLGPAGAARRYAPQKGADPETVARLELGLARWAAALEAATGRRLRDLPGAGAAGGTGLGLAALGFALVPGAATVLDALGFDAALARADLVLTGEGRADASTADGKAPAEVIRRARAAGVPVVLVAGARGPGAEGLGAPVVAAGREPDPAAALARAAAAAVRGVR